jgi:predicted RNA-binding Zn ribbon-like protein
MMALYWCWPVERQGIMARPTAPGALALVQAFINTVDLESRQEELASPAHLRDWLAGNHLLAGGEPIDDGDLDRALALREALRALLYANAGEPLAPFTLTTLNELAGNAPLLAAFGGDGSAALEPAAAGFDGGIGRLLAIVVTAMVDGSWSRLKACRRHQCRWAYYDTSKNRSGAWCSMAVCGNRTKVSAYQRRHRSGAGAPQDSSRQ